jgi:uncharacterized membrane protein YcaP (DUF421 family)
MLIYRGRLNTKNMSKAKITLAEMQESIREHGVAGVENVDLAILETDGNISILSNEFKHHTIKKRRVHKSFLQKNE